MKKILMVIIVLILLSGCSKSKYEQFDDHKIQISLVNSQILGNTRTYSVKLKNNGNFTMKNTVIFLSYQKKVSNGTQSNPFKVEAKSTLGNQNLIKPGDEVQFEFIAPVGDYFPDISMFDIDHPYIEFRGFHLTPDNKEIPFGMSGNSFFS